MPQYRAILSRIFAVEILAENEESAARLAEFYVGFGDSSLEADRKQHHFQIEDIRLIENNVIETNRVEA